MNLPLHSVVPVFMRAGLATARVSSVGLLYRG